MAGEYMGNFSPGIACILEELRNGGRGDSAVLPSGSERGGGTINERLGGRKVGTELREMARKTSWLRTEARTEEEEGEEEMCVFISFHFIY